MKKVLKYIGLSILTCIAIVIAYLSFLYFTRNYKSGETILIEATFMQYACGDEIDDMKINSVDSKKYYFLLGKDIDPQVITSSKESELKGYFYENRTEEYGLKYRLKGRLSKFYNFGCDNTTPKFWVEEIEKIDGSRKITKVEIVKMLSAR